MICQRAKKKVDFLSEAMFSYPVSKLLDIEAAVLFNLQKITSKVTTLE